MLYNLDWLKAGEQFPPLCEQPRIQRYRENTALFNGDHFVTNSRSGGILEMYRTCAQRISRVVGNFEDVVSFPILLNYQRLMSLKMADLVCGEYPTITGATPEENEQVREMRESTDFDAKLYSTVLDISRYGDAIWRRYIDEDGNKTFTCWDPREWYPIVTQDGTLTVTCHCLCWRENRSPDYLKPDWYLHVQLHWCDKERRGTYEEREYKMSSDGTSLMKLLNTATYDSGFDECAVEHLKAFSTTNTVYGYDDYMQIDSVLSEIIVRVSQISAILDKHADPNITGPASMLDLNPETGEYYLKSGKFFATSVGENKPEYMTWDGQLSAAFQQLEFLINQLFLLSEMGSALLGATGSSSEAVSGTAMRFKMVNPLAKARRIANSLTRPVKRLFSSLNESGPIDIKNISVFWSDGLPDDPRENIENCKLATGATQMMPLETAIMEYFNRSNEEAKRWIDMIRKETEDRMMMMTQQMQSNEPDDPNKPGPQDGTGVNSQKKGSETGLKNFSGLNNK